VWLPTRIKRTRIQGEEEEEEKHELTGNVELRIGATYVVAQLRHLPPCRAREATCLHATEDTCIRVDDKLVDAKPPYIPPAVLLLQQQKITNIKQPYFEKQKLQQHLINKKKSDSG
jgi:hypothetical protein